MSVTMDRVLGVTGGKTVPGTDLNREFKLFTTDSREATGNNALFVAFKGERNDGHDYVAQVLENGRNGALIEDERFLQPNTVLVKSSRLALQSIAADYREHELKNTLCIGITGSVGKTTAKEMTVKCLSAKYGVSYTQGNRNSQVGVPRTVLEIPEDCGVAVLEMGMSLPGEMERIAKCAMPDVVMIINIGTSHIEAFGTREGIRDEKLTILKGLREGGKIIVNGDEPLLCHIESAIKCGVENKDNQVYAYNITGDENGTEFDVSLFGEVFHTRISTIGLHNVYDALFAFAAGHVAGMSAAEMKDTLSDYTPVGDRQRIFVQNGVRIIADCYNASPESVKAALKVLDTFGGRKIAVLGDMLELGASSEELHRQVGAAVSESGADMLVCIGKEMAYAAEESKNISVKIFEKEDFDGATAYIKGVLLPDTTVLFKGSRGMKLENIMKKVFEI